MGPYAASLAALFAAGAWGLGSLLLLRQLRDAPHGERPSAVAINGLRNGIALLLFLALWGLVGGAAPRGAAWGGLALSGALGFALGDALYFAALARCGVQTAAMVGLLNVPLSTLLAWFWLGQALDATTLGSMGLVVAGVALVLRDRPARPPPARRVGAGLACAAALLWSLGTVGGHAAMQEVGTFPGAFVRLAGATVAVLLLAVLSGLRPRSTARGELEALALPFRRPAVARTLLPAILCMAVLNLVPFHFALRELPGAIGALLFSTTPLFTLPLAPLFGERPGRRAVLGTLVGFAGVVGVVLSAPEVPVPALQVVESSASTLPGARWPDLAVDARGEVRVLSLQPGAPSRLMVAGEQVAEGRNWFENWADFPQLAFMGQRRVVTWLEKIDRPTFAYGVRLRVDDGPPQWLHDDDSPSEHGFVSLVPLGGERLFAAWLDGRWMPDGGAMTLRARTLGQAEFELDDRVCECCQTDAARLGDGRVLVAWRDRSDAEVRDIAWSVGDPREAASFSAPRLVHADGWEMASCPVNGPAVAADGQRAAIAWFTRAGGGPGVFVAFAQGKVSGFSEPVRVDEGNGDGRIDAVFLGRDLLVAWLEKTATGAEWRARCVASDGRLGPVLAIAAVTGGREDGFLRMARDGDGVLAAFRDAGEDTLRVLRISRR